MNRRRYLVLAGALSLAGCSEFEDGGTPTDDETDESTPTGTETATATATETDSPTESETDTPTETGTDEVDVATNVEEARARIQQGLALYVDAWDGAESIRDVGPGTLDFPTEDVQAEFTGAREQLEAVAESASDDEERTVTGLRNATTWLHSAAGIQGEMSTLAAALESAAAAGEDGEDHETIADRLADAQDATGLVADARAGMERPDRRPFRAVSGLEGRVATGKHDDLQREAVGIDNLSELLDRTFGAVDVLREAEELYDDEDYDDAESEASDAASEFLAVENRAEDLNPNSLQPFVELFDTALGALRDRARALEEDADEQ